MEDQDQKFYIWHNERKQGKLRYVTKSVLMISLGLILGKFIGHFVSDSALSNQEFFEHLPFEIGLMLLVVVPISFVAWYIREAKYQKELKRREHITRQSR